MIVLTESAAFWHQCYLLWVAFIPFPLYTLLIIKDYLPTVLIESVKLENSQARLLAACNSVSYLLFSLIGIPNVERWGRRKLMMYAAAGQCFCYLMITVLLRYTEIPSYSEEKREKIASASIAFFFLYYVFFGIGWQGVPVRRE